MSGIAGLFNRNGQDLDLAHLSQMMEALAHRGPDGSHTWSAASVGLGHCMLWTTPESLREQLPTASATDNLIITADARIDNRDELMERLGWRSPTDSPITDSQLILGAYELWGDTCPQYLIGDFAFAIWDLSQQCLFCARDHVGVKPFYYYQSLAQFAFASEMKALLKLPNVSSSLNPVRLGDFILLLLPDKVLTTYQDILRLPPAHTLKVTATTFEIQEYWSLDPTYELRLESEAAYAEEFRRIFTEAIRCRLRSAFPIGAHLSGGLDSSAVACVARDLLQQAQKPPLHTLSNIFDEVTDCDERPFIDAVLAQGGVVPHYIHADQFGPLTDLEVIRQHEDEALLGPSHHYPWRLSQKAQELGLRIVLDGLDGDNAVCHGMTRLKELAHQGQWDVFTQEVLVVADHYQQSPRSLFAVYGADAWQAQMRSLRWISVFKGAIALHQKLALSWQAIFWQWGFKPLIAKPLQLLKKPCWSRRNAATNCSPTSRKTDLLTPEFQAVHDFEGRFQQLDRNPHTASTVREYHWQSLNQGIIPFVLEQFDRTAAACHIEERHPFMDKRLLEFCLALPSELKLSQGWGRFVLRQGLAGILPEAIRWRGGKTSMTPNFKYGLIKRDRSILEKLVANDLSKIEPYVFLDTFWQSYREVLANQGNEKDWIWVWRVVILAHWLKQS